MAKIKWTRQQEEVLIKLYYQYGKKCTIISKQLEQKFERKDLFNKFSVRQKLLSIFNKCIRIWKKIFERNNYDKRIRQYSLIKHEIISKNLSSKILKFDNQQHQFQKHQLISIYLKERISRGKQIRQIFGFIYYLIKDIHFQPKIPQNGNVRIFRSKKAQIDQQSQFSKGSMHFDEIQQSQDNQSHICQAFNRSQEHKNDSQQQFKQLKVYKDKKAPQSKKVRQKDYEIQLRIKRQTDNIILAIQKIQNLLKEAKK